MLEFIRNHVNGVLGLALVVVLAAVFTLAFGSQSEGWGKGTGSSTVITVAGTKLSMATLDYAMNMTLDREMSPESPEYHAVRQQVTRSLIERELLLHLASQAGISASTDEAMENIIKGTFFVTRPMEALTTQLAFQVTYGGMSPDLLRAALVRDGHRVSLGSFTDENGRFDLKSFDRTIRYRLNFKEDSFIEQQRRELIAQRMRALILNDVSVTPAEIRMTYELENDTVSLSYIRITPQMFEETLDLSESTIRTWAQQNTEAIEQYYEANKFRYSNVEKSARSRHILIKVDSSSTDEDRDTARTRIAGILAEVKDGADFAAMARDNSDDAQSASRGGDLGYTPRGVMVPEFDDVLFSLSAGEISDIVETEFGFHIIRLESIREGNVSLEEATIEIATQLYLENEGTILARNLGTQMVSALLSGSSLDQIVESSTTAMNDDDSVSDNTETTVQIPDGISLDIQNTRDFQRHTETIPGIGVSSEIVEKAFSLTDSQPAADQLFELDKVFYVLVLNERKTPSDDDFEIQKAVIENRLLSAKLMTWIKDRMANIVNTAAAEGQIKSMIPFDTVSNPIPRS